MRKITVICGDITQLNVDAVVNAANNAMRGGGGVDGAIHRAGGPAILRDCIEKFPQGLATGDAGWTNAGDLPAHWIIHTVGPNYAAGQRDRLLLESCYRRALEVADTLGAQSVAFPLISAGVYGWPRRDAIGAAVDSVALADTSVEEVQLVAFDFETQKEIRARMQISTPIRILQGIQALHRRGYHRVRAVPGIGGPGSWRIMITTADNLSHQGRSSSVRDHDAAIFYSIAAQTEFAGGDVDVTSRIDAVADLMLDALPSAAPTADDPAYVLWFADLVQLAESGGALPIAYADYFDDSQGWEIGWDSGRYYPHPPMPPRLDNATPTTQQQGRSAPSLE